MKMLPSLPSGINVCFQTEVENEMVKWWFNYKFKLKFKDIYFMNATSINVTQTVKLIIQRMATFESSQGMRVIVIICHKIYFSGYTFPQNV